MNFKVGKFISPDIFSVFGYFFICLIFLWALIRPMENAEWIIGQAQIFFFIEFWSVLLCVILVRYKTDKTLSPIKAFISIGYSILMIMLFYIAGGGIFFFAIYLMNLYFKYSRMRDKKVRNYIIATALIYFGVIIFMELTGNYWIKAFNPPEEISFGKMTMHSSDLIMTLGWGVSYYFILGAWDLALFLKKRKDLATRLAAF